MLDAHQLNVFLMAAETLNFTKAAQQLHMSQPSVSQHIKSLETYLDVPLFLRSGRSIKLTDSGVALVPLAREFVNQSIQIEEEMVSLSGKIHGHLKIGCCTTPGKYVFPIMLSEFHHEYPNVTLECQVAPQAKALESLSLGELHFTLASLVDKPDLNIKFYKFMCDPVVLITPLDHSWAKRDEINVEELVEADFILREKSSGTYDAVRESLAQLGFHIEQLRILLTLGNSEAIALAVKEGLGVGFVSMSTVVNICPDKVAVVKVAGLDICRDIYLARNMLTRVTRAQKAFWNFMRSLEIPIVEFDIS